MNHAASLELILGGARSGKSRLAERRALADGRALIYLATGTPGDAEMTDRIAHHRARRGPEWQSVEEPLALGAALRAYARAERCIVVDCLTLWLSNCLLLDCWPAQCDALFDALDDVPGRIVFVSNEVGSGIVPLGALSRRFVDECGRLHQRLAARAERVTLVVAGLPLELKNP
ncbi:MAG: bifunctional adenosylcobinamide kinase/adenosylcobinamide-phosphate guanylyltransferase [Gammaproteobacteria bacterium]|nr:bifunctional adenosylcobinamide kinase/adenosylcobinamide-phosphate guanylyltransferase [Gammaproteobacteria bacterium]